jgi:hypothetical protein
MANSLQWMVEPGVPAKAHNPPESQQGVSVCFYCAIV